MPTKIQPQITCSDHEPCTGKFCKHIIGDQSDGDKLFCGYPDTDRFLCDEVLKYEPSRVNHSAIQDHLLCPTLDYYKNIRGLEPVSEFASDAIKMGNIFESVLQIEFEPDCKLDLEAVYDKNPLQDRELAIMRAIFRAMVTLKLTLPAGEWQVKRVIGVKDEQGIPHPVSFIYDVLFEDGFGEVKLTGQMKYHDNIGTAQNQVGLYMALNPEMKYAVMYVCSKPQLKVRQESAKLPEESTEIYVKGMLHSYEQRVYESMVDNPKRFFLGYKKGVNEARVEVASWGKRFYRTDFDLDELRLRAIEVSKLRQRSIINNYWMKNTTKCDDMFGRSCEFKPVCGNRGKVGMGFKVKTIKLEER